MLVRRFGLAISLVLILLTVPGVAHAEVTVDVVTDGSSVDITGESSEDAAEGPPRSDRGNRLGSPSIGVLLRRFRVRLSGL